MWNLFSLLIMIAWIAAVKFVLTRRPDRRRCREVMSVSWFAFCKVSFFFSFTRRYNIHVLICSPTSQWFCSKGRIIKQFPNFRCSDETGRLAVPFSFFWVIPLKRGLSFNEAELDSNVKEQKINGDCTTWCRMNTIVETSWSLKWKA